jgi:murein DD-endopeptidase MepM/ murein hydrolase activator NlpD
MSHLSPMGPKRSIRALATGIVGLLGLGLVGFLVSPGQPSAPPEVTEPAPPLVPKPPPVPKYSDVTHTIVGGETLGAILPRYGVSDVNAVVEAASEHTDLTRIRAGRELVFTFQRRIEAPISLRYQLDEDNTLVVHLDEETPRAELETVTYGSRQGARSLVVEGSLWNAALDAGLRPGDIVRLARVFEYEVDFNTELRAGATFTVVGEELTLGGEFAKMGELQAVRLDNDGKVYTAVYFERSDGEAGWFHPDGTASKKPFLRSPLEFSRVTSGFNPKRYHPVLKKSRPHYGTDFGAPTGTPIRATGNGKVVFSGTKGGYGKHVKLDHPGPYTSSYSHLSKIAVKNGASVKQGQVIGYVGATGLATGPHLHYEFRQNGKPVDAMKIDLPTVEPLPKAEMAAFLAEAERVLPMLDGPQDSGLAVADSLEARPSE